MNSRQKRKSLELRKKNWSLRDIARELGLSHETVRTALAAEPPPAGAPKPPRRRKRKPVPTQGTLLGVCKALLAELRRRARETAHPSLGPRFSGDATALAGLVLRLETQAARGSDGVAMTISEIRERRARVRGQLAASIEAKQRSGALVCSDCGLPLAATLRADEPPPAVDASKPTEAKGVDGMLDEARKTLAWLIESADASAHDGNELATQRFGRGAVSIAGFVARLEKAIAATRVDQIHISREEIEKRRTRVRERFRSIRERPLLCGACNRKLSVLWGTGQPSTADEGKTI